MEGPKRNRDRKFFYISNMLANAAWSLDTVSALELMGITE